MRNEYENRRNIINKRIKGTWLQESSTMAEGAFYTLIDVAHFEIYSLDLSKK